MSLKFACCWKPALSMVLGFSAYLALVIVACSEAPYKPADTEAPVVRIIYPPTGTVVGRNLPVVAEASDDETVAEVRFFFDDAFAHKDEEAPYEWLIRPAPETSSHKVTAWAYDVWGNCGVSDSLTIRFGWSHIFSDRYDAWAANLLALRLRSDSTFLYLQIELSSFVDDYDETRPDAVELYAYLDTDCLASTGNPIEESGAEYAMLFRWSTDSLYNHELLRWNAEWQFWEYRDDPEVIEIARIMPILRAAIPLAGIAQPDSVDMVLTSSVYEIGDGWSEDRMPDRPQRCFRCKVDRLYIGDDFQTRLRQVSQK